MAALILTASVGALADYTVTINQNTADRGTHTYGAYQIFTGDLTADGTLSNIAWGSGITAAGQNTLGDASEYAASITESNVATKADQLAGYLASAEATGSTSITGLAGGYYLIKDETGSPTGTSPKAQTKYILKVTTAGASVNVKSSVPTVTKQVEDKNDTTGSTATSYGDSADHDIGDTINFKLTATLGSGISNYKQYYLKFKDAMSAGFTMGSITSIIVDYDGNAATTNDQVDITGTKAFAANGTTTVKAADGTTDLTATNYELTISNLFDETGVTKASLAAGSTVTVIYTATLNEDAVIGSNGNPNEVTLVYSSNPNYEGDGTTNPPTEETPKDRNVVFTYKTVINKVQPNPEHVNDSSAPEYISLATAGFTLYKEVATATSTSRTKAQIEGAYTDTSIESSKLITGKNYETISFTETAGESATFTFSGLDDGYYVLVETKVPEGFNAFKSIGFTISAEHDLTNADNPQLTKLMNSTGGTVILEGNQQGTVNLANGSITSQVINEKGSTLPETGGIGTTIFYVAGSILVLAAVVLLITKRRMGNED